MGISEELYILWSAVWAGCLICGSYKLFTVARYLVKHKEFIIAIEDFTFWIITSVYIFSQLIKVNNGNWRIYFLLGIVLGAWSIHTIWCVLRKVFRKMLKTLKIKGKESMIDRNNNNLE